MFTTVINALHLLIIPVEGISQYRFNQDRQYEEETIMSLVLLLDANSIIPDTVALNKYVTSLEDALKPNMSEVTKNIVTSYGVINELLDHTLDCVQISSALNELRRVNSIRWSRFCQEIMQYLDLCDNILKLLNRNSLLLSENGKMPVSTDLIYANILNEIRNVKEEDTREFKDFLKNAFGFLVEAVNVMWDRKIKRINRYNEVTSCGDKDKIENIKKILETAKKHIKDMNDSGVISNEQTCNIIILFNLLENNWKILYEFAYEIYINGTILWGPVTSIERICLKYIDLIGKRASISFQFAVQRDKMVEFFKMIRPNYLKVARKRYTPELHHGSIDIYILTNGQSIMEFIINNSRAPRKRPTIKNRPSRRSKVNHVQLSKKQNNNTVMILVSVIILLGCMLVCCLIYIGLKR